MERMRRGPKQVGLLIFTAKRDWRPTGRNCLPVPLGAMYLVGWLEMCRLAGHVEVWDAHIGGGYHEAFTHPTLLFWIEPGAVREAINAAVQARRQNPKVYIAAIGPGMYASDRDTFWPGPNAFDFIVRGYGWGAVETIMSNQDKPIGSIEGERGYPPVKLSRHAADYGIGRLLTTWGRIRGVNYSARVASEMWDFRRVNDTLTDIALYRTSKATRFVEVTDPYLFIHPKWVDVVNLLNKRGSAMPWSVTLDCSRKHGEISRLQWAAAGSDYLRLIFLEALTRNTDSLTGIGRQINRKDVERVFKYVKMLRKHDVTIVVRLAYGLPHQTWDDVIKDMDYFEDDGVCLAVEPLRLDPGTRLWSRRDLSYLGIDEDNRVCSTRWMTRAEITNMAVPTAVANEKTRTALEAIYRDAGLLCN